MHDHRVLRGLACAFSLLLACTDKGGDTTDETATDAQTSDSETGAPVAGCECAEGDPCSVELCETAWYLEDEDTGGDSPELELDLTCALEALRDRKAGHISWHYRTGDDQYDQYGRFEMFGDGTARYHESNPGGSCPSIVDALTVVTLKDPSVFADCLTESSTGSRFSCLRAATQDRQSTCVAGKTACDDG
ncbi:hypothetical protein [Nannocystis pusilla]|uniref:hypothetical protein n=1 Tax=Nannocystis pusilla TaxID=889268 RepID=UPI003BF136F9